MGGKDPCLELSMMSDGVPMSFKYDALGRMTQKSVAGGGKSRGMKLGGLDQIFVAWRLCVNMMT